jgi:hypothetical protein
MAFSSATRAAAAAFVSKYKSTVASGYTGIEMATRPEVHGLLASVLSDLNVPNMEMIHDQFVPGTANKPDWAVYEAGDGGLMFYGDHKPAGSGGLSLSKAERAQIYRYLEMGSPVFVFDGVEFLLFEAGSRQERKVSLLPRDALSSDAPIVMSAEVIPLLRRWTSVKGFRRASLADLIEQAAKKASFIRADIEGALELDRGDGKDKREEAFIDAVKSLQEQLVASGRNTLAVNAACSDYVAQILAFGLVYAHVSESDDASTPEKRRTALLALYQGLEDESSGLPPFAEIVNAVGDTLNAEDETLGYWYQDAIRYFSNVSTPRAKDVDYHALFEDFLEIYDPKSRYDNGAFYTPRSLADWLARQADSLSLEHFSGSLESIADQVIDPCCGTGGILESLLARSSDPDSKTEYVGIEIMPVPYALAQFRLNGGGVRANRKVSLYLADTLDDSLSRHESLDPGEISAEILGAKSHTSRPVRVVIGNPPSVQHPTSGVSRTGSDSQLELFRPDASNRSSRSNVQKALNNDAVRFLVWSAAKVIESGHGILALILPGSFASGISFIGARKWLLANFDDVRVVELDADLRTGEASDSIFETRQGRLALFAVRRSSRPASATFGYADVRALDLDAKNLFLAESSPIRYESTSPLDDSEYRFVGPKAKTGSNAWAAGEPIFGVAQDKSSIFLNKTSGMKLAPTALLFHTDKRQLRRRSIDISAKNAGVFRSTAEEIRSNWFQGQKKPVPASKLSERVRSALGEIDGCFAEYAFRPFTYGQVILKPEIFAGLGEVGGGTRDRPELQAAVKEGAVGLIVSPDPTALGAALGVFAAFTWGLVDNDFVARGNAMVYMDKWVRRDINGNDVVESNINPDSRVLAAVGTPRRAMFYVYAILSSNAYAEKFYNDLYRPSAAGYYPRVPVLSEELSNKLADLGEILANAQDPTYSLESFGATVVTEAISMKWPDAHRELRIARTTLNPEMGTVTLWLKSGEKVVVSGIPQALLDLRVCGHDVAKKWWREREDSYLRRSFVETDLAAFTELISRLQVHESTRAQIDLALQGQL